MLWIWSCTSVTSGISPVRVTVAESTLTSLKSSFVLVGRWHSLATGVVALDSVMHHLDTSSSRPCATSGERASSRRTTVVVGEVISAVSRGRVRSISTRWPATSSCVTVTAPEAARAVIQNATGPSACVSATSRRASHSVPAPVTDVGATREAPDSAKNETSSGETVTGPEAIIETETDAPTPASTWAGTPPATARIVTSPMVGADCAWASSPAPASATARATTAAMAALAARICRPLPTRPYITTMCPRAAWARRRGRARTRGPPRPSGRPDGRAAGAQVGRKARV